MDGGAQSPEICKARGQTLRLSGQVLDLLPTVTAVDSNTVAKSELDARDPKHRLKVRAQVIQQDDNNWGDFEPAIHRWEETIGFDAPDPTLPDGQKGQHRLNAKFTEWMMGLEPGWITGHGLSRRDEIKMAGNGVVPQQAKYALSILLDRIG